LQWNSAGMIFEHQTISHNHQNENFELQSRFFTN
jgi:hypothetical protein